MGINQKSEQKTMKTALYVRVSKDEMSSDGKLQDPENQLIPLRHHCQAMGWEISA